MTAGGEIDQDASDAERAAHARGFALTLFGVMVLTPDTLLIRLIDTDPWTMTFWRGLLMPSALMIAYWVVRRGKMWADIRGLGWAGLAVSGIYAVNALSFVLAVEHTKVANVLVILAAAPLFAGLFSVIFLRERVPLPTWAAIAAGVAGVAIVVGGGFSAGTSVGDLFALLTAFSLAGTFTVIRKSKARNMVPATALGGFLTMIAMIPLADPGSLEGMRLGMMLLLGLVVLPIAFGLITLGPRTVPAPEVALLMLLETVLGPFWVWLAIGEAPGLPTYIGGAVVLGAVALHAVWRLSRRRRVRPHPPPHG
ncbi:MAG: DMT family transporter [Marivibrio sp.]|uniref:DMT family transporter n=1 Tax=Marivibrio sp. TaxID=2039719 RepID=UPI0032EFFAFA